MLKMTEMCKKYKPILTFYVHIAKLKMLNKLNKPFNRIVTAVAGKTRFHKLIAQSVRFCMAGL